MRQLLMVIIVMATLMLTLMTEWFGLFLSLVFFCFVIGISYSFLLGSYENGPARIQRVYSTASWSDLGF
jgi:hypothetical protein